SARMSASAGHRPRMLDLPTQYPLSAPSATTAAWLATRFGGLLELASESPNSRPPAFGLAFACGPVVCVTLGELQTKSLASFSMHYGERLGFTWGTLSFLAGVLVIVTIDRLVPNPHERLEVDDPYFREHNRDYVRRVG